MHRHFPFRTVLGVIFLTGDHVQIIGYLNGIQSDLGKRIISLGFSFCSFLSRLLNTVAVEVEDGYILFIIDKLVSAWYCFPIQQLPV